MVTKKKKRNKTEERSKAKVSDLKLNKETVKELTDQQIKNIPGGGQIKELSTAYCQGVVGEVRFLSIGC